MRTAARTAGSSQSPPGPNVYRSAKAWAEVEYRHVTTPDAGSTSTPS